MIFDDCEAHVLDWLAQLPASHERSRDSSEAAAWFDGWMAIDAKNEEIDRAEKWGEPTASESLVKHSELARLRGERATLFACMGLDAVGGAVDAQAAPDASRLDSEVALVAQHSDTDKHGRGWALKKLIRAPGYRWPLYHFLKHAHAAGEPCPKAREVLDAWALKPPPDLQVMPDGLKYNDSQGKPKEATLKAIQQAIKGLVEVKPTSSRGTDD